MCVCKKEREREMVWSYTASLHHTYHPYLYQDDLSGLLPCVRGCSDVCVCMRERERERERNGVESYTASLHYTYHPHLYQDDVAGLSFLFERL